jgi:RHS repeat-associated protein
MLIDKSDGTTKTYYFQRDDLNTVHALLDHNGTAVERYDYSAYGETRILDSNGQTLMVDDDLDEEFDLDHDGIIDIGYPREGELVTPRVIASQSQFDNPFGYAGMRRDEHSGLYHTHYREYNPNLGRWLTPDPAGYKDGQNLYAYYPNVNGVDLLGLNGPDDPEWAHLLPTGKDEFLSEAWTRAGIDRNAAEWGVLMRSDVHRRAGGKHPAGWDRDLTQWVRNQQKAGTAISPELVRNELDRMMHSEKYAKYFDDAVPSSAINILKDKIKGKSNFSKYSAWEGAGNKKAIYEELLKLKNMGKTPGARSWIRKLASKGVTKLTAVVTVGSLMYTGLTMYAEGAETSAINDALAKEASGYDMVEMVGEGAADVYMEFSGKAATALGGMSRERIRQGLDSINNPDPITDKEALTPALDRKYDYIQYRKSSHTAGDSQYLNELN